MAKIKIDTWYDIRCDCCNLFRSTDIDGGLGTEMNKRALRIYAKREGWKCRGGKTLCPSCAKKYSADKTPAGYPRRTRLRIQPWYDLRCDVCCLARSTDYGLGMESSKGVLQHDAYMEGWGNREGETLCPKCLLERRSRK